MTRMRKRRIEGGWLSSSSASSFCSSSFSTFWRALFSRVNHLTQMQSKHILVYRFGENASLLFLLSFTFFVQMVTKLASPLFHSFLEFTHVYTYFHRIRAAHDKNTHLHVGTVLTELLHWVTAERLIQFLERLNHDRFTKINNVHH